MAGGAFGGAALRLAGFCGLQLGWSPAQFWVATPAEVAAIAAVLAPAELAAAAAGPVTMAELRRLESGDG